MKHLNEALINEKIKFIDNYINSNNAADGSKFDANANVTMKNIATLESEINKDVNILVNRHLVYNKIKKLFSKELADEYLRQIENHEIYVHDETSLKPYCASVSMYPLLIDGLTKLGGESKAPKNLMSFSGIFVNFVFAVSSQFAGAIATVEFLTYMDYFARKDFGDDYLQTQEKMIDSCLQQIIYSINQPAAARGYQSVFWNISLYDEYYFNALFENFVFPDGSKPHWPTVKKLQKYFMTWFNEERNKALLTFPVVTAAMLTDGQKAKDREFVDMCSAELAKGNSFFMYLSESADSLASCCRLRNEVNTKEFSYTLGAGGVATGSINVITINFNRLIQDQRDLSVEIGKIHNYQIAYRKLMEDYLAANLLPVYSAGFITLDKQYLTIGINGLVEAAEYLGYEIDNNKAYKDFVITQLNTIYKLNQEKSKLTGYKFNTEFVPAENLGVKNAGWDQKDGYAVQRQCYNSYFYRVEDQFINPLEKFDLHGKEILDYLDGGSALHLNLEEYLTSKQYALLIDLAALKGCNYFCTNVKVTICNDCQNIDKKTEIKCSKCGSENIDYATRIIGYLKRITSFSRERQKEAQRRAYHKKEKTKHNEKESSPYIATNFLR